MPGNEVLPGRIEGVADRPFLVAALEPVVAGAAYRLEVAQGSEYKVVAVAGEGRRNIFAGDDEVLAGFAEEYVDAVAALNDVVAGIAVEDVVAAEIGDDVVAGAAIDIVDAVAAFDAVVAAVAVDGVVADAGDDRVGEVGAAEDDVVLAGVAQIVGFDGSRFRIVANDQRNEVGAADRVVPAVCRGR